MNYPDKQLKVVVLAVALVHASGASAFTFENGSLSGNFDSTVSAGIGVRAQSPACGLVLRDSSGLYTGNAGPSGAGAPGACTETLSGLGDQGNLNYGKGDAFTTYLKGTHELLVKMPEDLKFMARVSWLKDFSATRTTGHISAGNPSNASLPDESRDDLKFKARLLDFWVSKEFSLAGERARVRVGNQVVSWGESLFLPGGINQTNAMDLMRLSQPGTQLKEVFLPAPLVSFATGLGSGVNVEAYVQSNWNENYFPPTGSYWSMVNGLGKGHADYGLSNEKARNGGQYGAAVRWQPSGTQLNLGAYAMAYHDKAPQFSYNANGSGNVGWAYAQDRKLFGVSANFPLGDWAIGSELSYRPKDAVALNPATGCADTGGNCYVDEKKLQWHLTGLLSLTPSDYPFILNALGGASTATLLAEAVVVRYPKLQPFYNGERVAAGGWSWGLENDAAGTPESVGTRNSWGYNFDFSWVYDGSIIPGWQVIPEIYFFHAVKGRTPNAMATFMEGAKSANFIVNFVKNPASWQFGVNYAKFWSGQRVYDQPYKDRSFFGAYVSRNF